MRRSFWKVTIEVSTGLSMGADCAACRKWFEDEPIILTDGNSLYPSCHESISHGSWWADSILRESPPERSAPFTGGDIAEYVREENGGEQITGQGAK